MLEVLRPAIMAVSSAINIPKLVLYISVNQQPEVIILTTFEASEICTLVA